jgi:hypothetical protein
MSVDEVSAILERLVCRDFTPDKIVSASLRKNYKRYAPLLEVKIDRFAEREPTSRLVTILITLRSGGGCAQCNSGTLTMAKIKTLSID